MNPTMVSIAVLVLGSAPLLGCIDSSPDLAADGWLATVSQERDSSDIVIYEAGRSFDGRIDYAAGSELAGIFRATRSEMLIAGMTATEHGAVLRHQMTLTGSDGIPHRLGPGDAYIVKSGSELLLEIDGPSVQESFFAVHAP